MQVIVGFLEYLQEILCLRFAACHQAVLSLENASNTYREGRGGGTTGILANS